MHEGLMTPYHYSTQYGPWSRLHTLSVETAIETPWTNLAGTAPNHWIPGLALLLATLSTTTAHIADICYLLEEVVKVGCMITYDRNTSASNAAGCKVEVIQVSGSPWLAVILSSTSGISTTNAGTVSVIFQVYAFRDQCI